MAVEVHNYDILYQIDSKGKKRSWEIYVEKHSDDKVYVIKKYGCVGGKLIVNEKEIVTCRSQKTLFEQAKFEASSDWTKKNKDGYQHINLNTKEMKKMSMTMK